MAIHKRYCKRILKQYGKHIKNWENRLDNPLDDKRNTKHSEDLGIEYERRFEVPWYLKRGSKSITCYKDLEECAK